MRLSRTNFPGQTEAHEEGATIAPQTNHHHVTVQPQVADLPQCADTAFSAPALPYPSSAADAFVPVPDTFVPAAPAAAARPIPPVAVPKNAGDLPVWQSAFSLAPNVRFTRTPEKAIPRKPAPSAEVPPAAPAPLPKPVWQSASTSPPLQKPVVAPAVAKPTFEERAAQRGLVTRGLPTDAAPGARALVDELRREFVATRKHPLASETALTPTPPAVDSSPSAQSPEMPRLKAALALRHAAAPVAEAPVATPEQATVQQSRLSDLLPHMPDHLFWEAIDFASTSDDVEAVARVLPQAALAPTAPAAIAPARARAKAAVASMPVPVPQPVSVDLDVEETSPVLHYRMITLRNAAPAIQETPLPIEPVATEVVVPAVAPEIVAPVEMTTLPERPARRNMAAALASRRMPGLPQNAVMQPEDDFEFPSPDLLQQPVLREAAAMSQEALEQSAGLLETVLEDFGIKGEIVDVRPGPVVTLYEFEPAPGVKSSRVIGLSDDIARSMSALSARVAVVPGRNVIGIELPNPERETVFFRELIESDSYKRTGFSLPLCLGKTIGGEPVIADLAKMPHLLVAGTTGSGKSVSVNTMILSLLYRLRPDECRLIMVDPKMLELSIYDGIPHLLTPVVTDPKKAVLALKWAVREMEDRYRKMSRLGVRNIDGYNSRVAAARRSGETIMISVQVGFDRSTGEPLNEEQEMDLAALPYIVVIVDEMADLMMVAGKDIEGAIQRLAQMARAAGIHLIMATQRPSVDVITGTIKANFPTRISFQVTSKIDSRTILGEQGAENLLGQGDMLHMVGGGRITRVHGPYVADHEVESIVAHLKTQGRPQYLGTVTEDAEEPEVEEEDPAVFDKSAMGEEDGDDLYDRAVKVVLRDKKCSTSYIQRRLSVGYNRAASLVERMEKEGLVGPANHVGKRAIIAGGQEAPIEMPGV
jgi:S-DNA-T family DNA segregation ATPase FtsK/SpoIIIE